MIDREKGRSAQNAPYQQLSILILSQLIVHAFLLIWDTFTQMCIM